ncbi:Na+(H+)/acetate symporter ActP [Geomicrobium halophilum]|uniref:Na+(H+)/acetate symporter ActP n=1 Tax=Geomicrobium halophilum TaxID=549000 RepID=A0A841PZQ4_9BACL|nr:hypothetical protein [Geomicrobium halophilum]MBB6450292.1 Na+(H+)/acetate symporter ActP [Geomicrobium halophilum]
MQSQIAIVVVFFFLFAVFLTQIFFVLKWFDQKVEMSKHLNINVGIIIGMTVVILFGFFQNDYSITFMLILPLAIIIFCTRNIAVYIIRGGT